MGSKVKKILGMAAPLAGLIPGIGLPLAAGLGAGAGLASGGGLRGALSGALGAASLNPGISSLGTALGSTGATARGIGAGIAGAGAGAAGGGGLKNALMQGAASGLGAYGLEGGFSGITDKIGLTGPGSILGESAGSVLKDSVGPTQGSGVLGAATRSMSGLSSALSGGGVGGGSSTYSGGGGMNLSSILGAANDYGATEDAKKELERAQREAMTKLNPYLETGGRANDALSNRLVAGFDPSSLAENPSFKFNLDQGNKALDRANAARGGYYSGAALKEASDYNTNLANNFARDYYDQWANTNNQLAGQSGQGLSAAGGAADLAGTMGTARASATLGNASRLSQLLAGSGARRLVQLADGSYTYV